MPIAELTPRVAYTALIVTRGPMPGKISAAQKGDGVWGRKECPPTFIRVPLVASPEGVAWLMANGLYDLDAKQFVHRETGEVFNEDVDIVEGSRVNS